MEARRLFIFIWLTCWSLMSTDFSAWIHFWHRQFLPVNVTLSPVGNGFLHLEIFHLYSFKSASDWSTIITEKISIVMVRLKISPAYPTQKSSTLSLSHLAHVKHFWWKVLPRAETTSPSTNWLHFAHLKIYKEGLKFVFNIRRTTRRWPDKYLIRLDMCFSFTWCQNYSDSIWCSNILYLLWRSPL